MVIFLIDRDRYNALRRGISPVIKFICNELSSLFGCSKVREQLNDCGLPLNSHVKFRDVDEGVPPRHTASTACNDNGIMDLPRLICDLVRSIPAQKRPFNAPPLNCLLFHHAPATTLKRAVPVKR